ncbi:hypothetical protein BDV93DRAFT_528787 [Ceratobasidium sp. AG-I]|nr:hypothetical protein BDV93DRAFT_528787 [Ceratobasidium sp. AG-I]
MSSGTYTNSESSSATRGDEITRSFQSSFHNGEPTRSPAPPPSTEMHSQVSNSSAGSSHSKDEIIDSDHGFDGVPTARATKRDKIVGKVEQLVGKAIRDPELHERAVLRTVGGKDSADGLAVVDSKTL